MAQDYRYPLTRICLRSGALTLPRTMLGLFPEEGAITAVDAESGEEFQLEATGPRTIVGMGAFLDAHELDVNDELRIRPLEDGRFGFTAVRRVRKRDYAEPGAVRALLDELAQAELAANETEIRALYPELPAEFDLHGTLEGDERFVRFEGRWHARAALERRIDDEEAARGKPAGGSRGAGALGAGARGGAAPTADGRSAASGSPEPEAGAEAVPVPQGARTERAEAAAGAETGALEAGESQQEALWRSTWQAPQQAPQQAPRGAPQQMPLQPPSQAPRQTPHTHEAEPPRPARQPPASDGGARGDAPSGPADDEPRSSGSSVRERRAPRAVFPGDAALSREEEGEEDDIDLQHVGRARELLQSFGFRVEALGQGDLMAHAELGRRGYTVLVHALAFGQRLDWAALLARRRECGARYLAVFGDRRDLNRLQSPAELARATLWSWEGLHRARTLSRSVPLSPFDLQLHFEREGLFDHGLERFESDVAELVAERGAFSEVLTSLAGMRAPTVFLLEDLAGRGTLSRDLVLKVLERLVEAPFHLVARVAQGEFCLRQPVSDGLANLADYATSLRGRLPNRGRERLTGLGEPDLLQEEELFGDAEGDAVAGGSAAEDADVGDGGENGSGEEPSQA